MATSTEEGDKTMSEWPTCEYKGCYSPAAEDREASRHYGTNPQPSNIVFPGEDAKRHFCGNHLRMVRNALQSRQA